MKSESDRAVITVLALEPLGRYQGGVSRMRHNNRAALDDLKVLTIGCQDDELVVHAPKDKVGFRHDENFFADSGFGWTKSSDADGIVVGRGREHPTAHHRSNRRYNKGATLQQ